MTRTGGEQKPSLLRFLLFPSALSIASCAYQPQPSAYDPPGFFSGLWHGYIVFFSLVAGMFTDARVYAFPNSGWWYDLGFVIGLIALALCSCLMAAVAYENRTL